MAITNGNSVLFANGTQANYAAISSKLDNTFYVTSDTNNLYLGSTLIGSNVKDASYTDDKLVITLVSGTDVELDFSDIASAEATGTAIGSAISEAISRAVSAVTGEEGDVWGSGTDEEYTLWALKGEIDAVSSSSGVTSVNTKTGAVKISGSGTVTVSEDSDGKIIISGADTNTDTYITNVTDGTYVDITVTSGTTLAVDDSAIGTAFDDIVGYDTDTASSETIYGAKAYADALDGDTIKVSSETGIAYTGQTIASSIDDIDDRLIDVETWQDEYSAPTIPVYTIGTTITTDGYASTYQLFKDGDAVSGSIINIPKDQFLSDATIVTGTVTDGVYSSEGTNTYIKLEFQVTGDGIDPGTIYLDVQDFFDVYTEGTGIDITDNKISNTGVLSIEGVTGVVDLVAGNANVSISADTTAKTITISTTDTDTVTTINGRSGVITIGETSTNEDYLTVTDTNGVITIGTAGIGTAISAAQDAATAAATLTWSIIPEA